MSLQFFVFLLSKLVKQREDVSSPACLTCSLWQSSSSQFSFPWEVHKKTYETSYRNGSFVWIWLKYQSNPSIFRTGGCWLCLSNTLVACRINASEIRDAKCLIKAGMSSPLTYLFGERKCFSFVISNITATLFLIHLLMRPSKSDKTCTTKWVFDTNFFFSPPTLRFRAIPPTSSWAWP